MFTTGANARRARRLVPAACAGVLVLGLVSPVAAAPDRIPFAGVMYSCGSVDVTDWVGGNVYHFRNSTNDNLWSTGNPLLDGREANVVDGDINVRFERGVAHPRSTLYPTAVDGTWEIQITVLVGPPGMTAHGVGHGTGDLAGMTLFFRSPGDISIDPADNPSSGLPFAALIEGVIFAPRGTP